MKLIFKILTAPVTLVIDLFTLVCIGLISFSTFFLRLASGIVGILGILVLATYSVKNGFILLTIAFLVSPMGIPMIAVWFPDIRKATEYLAHFERNLKRCSGVTMNGTGAFSVKEGFIWQPLG